MHYTVSEVHQIVGGTLKAANPETLVTVPAFDSRRINSPAESLFFALQGSRNGADYIKHAADAGVMCFVVPEQNLVLDHTQYNFIVHPNPLLALQTLAAHHRSKFTGPVIGITGSNGKTIVKEWLFQLLGSDFHIHRSPRSYNSQIGVAVSLLGIKPWHQMAFIEAGISQPGEMEKLQAMIKPQMVICTHFGAAHDEGFSGRMQKATEKARLFEGADVVVYPADSVEIAEAVRTYKQTQPLTRFISWGRDHGAYRILAEEGMSQSTRIRFHHRATEHVFDIPFNDKASVDNAMTCLCALAALERWDEQHIEMFRHLRPLENRLEFTQGSRGNYLVNDSYSNDPDSLEVALDFLLRQQPGMPLCVILSDMEQSDPDKTRLNTRIAGILQQKQVKKLIAVGSELAITPQLFADFQVTFFPDTDALLKSQELAGLHDMAVLIKGARSFTLEKVFACLKKQLHKTRLQIDLEALRHNYRYFKGLLPSQTKLMAMVKAFGYGSGSFEVARTLQFMGVDYLAVAYADEGVALRDAGIHLPVMVMNSSPADIAARPGYNLEPVVFDDEGLKELIKLPEGSKIHLELDTGMHRLGFNSDYIADALQNIPGHIKVASVFSHLSASEDASHDAFTLSQIHKFKEAAATVEKTLGYPVLKHILNSGGILRFPHSALDMVRLGIGLYGVDPRPLGDANLRPVTSFYSSISQLRMVKAGDSVGYSRKAIGSSDRMIATLPVGYADGLRRSLGNEKGFVLVNGHKAPLLGSICMDMCMADVTGISCNVGDEVELFGPNLNIAEWSRACDTIPYEILTGISPRVPRVYVGES